MPIKKPAPDAIKKREHAQSMPACSPRSKVILGLDNQHGIYRDTPSMPRKGRCAGRPGDPFRGRLTRLGEMSEEYAQPLHRGSGGSMYTRKAHATREAPMRDQG